MKIHVTNTDNQVSSSINEADLKDSIRELCNGYVLNRRHETTLFVWHGKNAPSPAIEVRDIHGKTARMLL